MIIRSIRLNADTSDGNFGFSFNFGKNLTIIKSKNSSGKSTLFNCVLYALGMEELIGGTNEKALPSAVRDLFEYEGRNVSINTSEVLLEIGDHSGTVVTLRRAIRNDKKSSKLVEVFNSAHLTKGQPLGPVSNKYLHDGGAAIRAEGFHRYLEEFLKLELPEVPNTKGTETKLYLQTIFAAFAIEQKRGWSNYIANVPFYGIQNARTKVAEFILNLSTFQTAASRNKLNLELKELSIKWYGTRHEIMQNAERIGFRVENIPLALPINFKRAGARVIKTSGNLSLTITDKINELRMEYEILQRSAGSHSDILKSGAVLDIEASADELNELLIQHARATSFRSEKRMALKDYRQMKKDAEEDLVRNKTVEKLRDLGAAFDIATANECCPTCKQRVDDALLTPASAYSHMDLKTNIAYLESQIKMLGRQIGELEREFSLAETNTSDLRNRISEKSSVLRAMRGDIISEVSQKTANIRRQIQIEMELESLERFEENSASILARLEKMSRYALELRDRKKNLTNGDHTLDDIKKIKEFEFRFRRNADLFHYKSAPIQKIEIDKDTLSPCLAKIELREIRSDTQTDIKSDSSASDFIRLIWSYLLALYQTSSAQNPPGNHPRLLMLDEPGQHSMSNESLHVLLSQLAVEADLQSIVAASFDEDDNAFQDVTKNVPYHLITWEGRLMRPLP